MTVKTGNKIWMNGRFKDWNECNIHIMSHVIHYGSSVFEGIRCYKSKDTSIIFRLKEHMQRLLDSAKIYRMDSSITVPELCDIAINLVKENNMEDCYIRPLMYRGFGAFGLVPFDSPIELSMACWSWGAYLGSEALEKGIEAKVSSWNRFAQNTIPAIAKAGGNYLNSQLIKMEALLDGYKEGIALDSEGFVSEGSAANLFVVKNGKLITPDLSCSILQGITRDTTIDIAKDLGIEVECQRIQRESLYLADELFFTGTAVEVTPISSVDKIKIGNGKRGPITQKLQEHFFKIIRQELPDKHEWLTKVY